MESHPWHLRFVVSCCAVCVIHPADNACDFVLCSPLDFDCIKNASQCQIIRHHTIKIHSIYEIRLPLAQNLNSNRKAQFDFLIGDTMVFVFKIA